MLESASASPKVTRNCLDPWIYIEVRTNGDIAPCCVRLPIASAADASLDQIRDGAAVRDLRKSLLDGTLDATCAGCLLRPLTTPDHLCLRVRNELFPPRQEAIPEVSAPVATDDSAPEQPADVAQPLSVAQPIPAWRRIARRLGLKVTR